MSTHAAAAPHDERVSLVALAANIRVMTVDLDELEEQGEDAVEWRQRIDLIVRLFLENRWKPPRKLSAVAPLSYVLVQGTDDTRFQDDVEALRTDLESYLFGEAGFEGVRVECLVGPVEEIEAIAQRAEDAFAAAKRAPAGATADVEAATTATSSVRQRHTADDPSWEGRLRLYAGYDAPKRAVVCYLAGLQSRAAAGAPVVFDDYASVIGSNVAGLEPAALRFAAARVFHRSKHGAVCYCLTPVRFETVKDRRTRDAYLELARKIPEDVRRYVVPSVFGADSGTPSGLLMEMVGGLQTAFPFIDWRTRTCAIDVDAKKQAHLFAVTLVLPCAPNARRKEFDAFPDFARRLAAHRIRAGVAGVADAAEARTLIAAGAQYLSGAAVSEPLPELEPRADVSLDDLPLHV